jgi:hypothetical protein
MLEWYGYGVTGHPMRLGDLVLLPNLILNLHNHPAISGGIARNPSNLQQQNSPLEAHRPIVQ